MTAQNPAALQGWVKSKDPKSGRVFYANHITRKTQWDPPADWMEEKEDDLMRHTTASTSARSSYSMEDEFAVAEEEPLPGNWEVMHDPTTGKPFYVDHERKITTWTRPRAEKKTAAVSLRPAVSSSSTASAAASRSRSSASVSHSHATSNSSDWGRSYQQEMAYYSRPVHEEVDLSDSLPPLEFSVKKVADGLRPQCPHCDQTFTMRLRRHHCRLCGDVFCDACSNHRVTLPLEGPEFDKPVRVCDFCNIDVNAGNFFSMRRYLTPLHLYDPNSNTATSDDEAGAVATASNVNAALSALTQDLEQMIQTGTVAENRSIPPDVLMPEILKHLPHSETADRVVRCVAALLAVEALTGATDYAFQLYAHPTALNEILDVLERSGTDRRTLYVQEQAARSIFYLTERKTVTAVLQKQDSESSSSVVDQLDLARAVRGMLDHASNRKNPNLQRWSAATVKNIIAEDQRRACLAVNDVAAMVAVGEPATSVAYDSFMGQLIETGGIMILCSLMSTDDADTRAHAVGALATALTAARAVDASLSTLAEMTGAGGGGQKRDGAIVRAIVAGGGCGDSVSQLLLSADHSVAGMGCQFLASLVMPLVSEPSASAALPMFYDYRNDTSAIGACREAAIELSTGSCLPALLSLVRTGGGAVNRPMELRKIATETLAAVVYAVGEMGKAWSKGEYEEGLDRSRAPTKFKEAIMLLNEEGVIDVALAVLQSGAGQSLGSTTSETPSSRIRESAGIILGSLTACSAEAILNMQTRQVMSSLLLSSNDTSNTIASTLRGDSAPRCLGILDTVSSILMFSWQHSSGASSELLDRLIEVIDAGAIPFMSRVLNAPTDWSSTSSVGSMKAKAAGCRLLCCLFGIALTDETHIGMKRLMDAVDSDATRYRKADKAPRNVMESALSILQHASSKAKSTLMGGGSSQAHYQTALMDLVDASLLAAGSMCGSSVAPGGSKGTMITGENFLKAREDHYVERRGELCNLACDVVVRGGRSSGPALLPTMLVGGFGEGTALSSVRLALAIAQNGTKEQHAKLASSGILVPISDSLRSALSSGDLYKFSAALALVRFCGPYVAAGQGGGLESVRDAIRVATNVLTLPVNPDASIEQLETQENLKSECISALEALSRNASLWSSISSDALPSIVRFLQMNVGGGPSSARRQQTQCAALRSVLQIVQVPSHAVSAAEGGLAEALAALLQDGDFVSEGDELPMLALEVLHAIAANDQARRSARFLDTGMTRSICAALGKSATLKPKKPSDSRADVTFLGLEIMVAVVKDIVHETTIEQVLQSPEAIAFLDAVSSEPRFVRALCATLLLKTNMKLPRHDSEVSGQLPYDIPTFFGPPLILVQEACGGYDDTHHAAAALLYTASVYACAIESQRSDVYWKILLLQDQEDGDEDDRFRLAATMSAHFLSLLTLDYKPFVPMDAFRKQEYMTITRPLVRYRLLESLKDCMEQLASESTYGSSQDPYLISVLVHFNVPHICLSLWKDPALLDLAFDLIKQIVDQDPDEVLHLFVEGEAAIMSLFDLLNLDSSIETSKNVSEIRKFLASILGQLAEGGLLASAVERFGVRSAAIGALAAACLSEEERTDDDEEEDTTSNRLASVLMKCLVQLCTVTDTLGRKTIRLSSVEAESIAKSLGKKICQMVLTRFLERAKLKQFEMEDDEDIMDAPDLAMLCAIAQHDNALTIVRSLGGLHALSLVAAEGNMLAMAALKKACESDPTILLEGDAHEAIMKVFSDESDEMEWKSSEDTIRQVEGSVFELLARLCTVSAKGRTSVAKSAYCEDCVGRAVKIVSALAGFDDGEVGDEGDLDMDEEENSPFAPPAPTAPSAPTAPTAPLEFSPLPPPPPSYDAFVSKTVVEEEVKTINESELGVSACLLLSSLAPMEGPRKVLVEDETFVKALSSLAGDTAVAELRYAGLKLVSAILPFVAGEDKDSTDRLSQVLLSALTSEHKLKATATLNTNLIHSTAVAGIVVVFDFLSTEQQEVAATAIATNFVKTVKLFTLTRSTAKQAQRLYAADLSHNLSVALLLIRGKDFMDTVFSQEVLTSFMHLVQWRVDPKTVIEKGDERPWDAAVSNCLLILSLLLWRPDHILRQADIDMKALASTSLMLARAGKAPRKAIDLKSALTRISEGNDASAAMASQRILDRLF